MEIFKNHPQYLLAEKICRRLQSQGFEAYLAGGCVRDLLLKRTPRDFDVATSAVPDKVEALFPKTLAVGKKFGVIVVVEGDEQVEVATFRQDGGYQDGRRPDSVEFCGAKEDALRRDFTINALFYDLASSALAPEDKVIDYVDGKKDLQARVIRTVGSAEARFQEDHLRILRAVRFVSQLGFSLEDKTFQACQRLAPQVLTVSGERIQEEFSKLLRGDFLEKGLEALLKSQVLSALLLTPNLSGVVWRDPKPHFQKHQGSLEAQWIYFFQWSFFLFEQRRPLSFFEGLCEQWKFSRDLKNKILKSLQWFYETEPFLKRSLGELLAFSYEPAHNLGLWGYAQFLLTEKEKPVLAQFRQRRQILGSDKPAPWVTSMDLMSMVSGEELGKALKQCYQRQLEMVISSKEELLKWWKDQHGLHS